MRTISAGIDFELQPDHRTYKTGFYRTLFRISSGFYLVVHLSPHQYPDLYDYLRQPDGGSVTWYVIDMGIWDLPHCRTNSVDGVCKYSNTIFYSIPG